MSKFSIILCIALFASAVNALVIGPMLMDIKNDAIEEIDHAILTVKRHMGDQDFGGFLNATANFGREVWKGDAAVRRKAFEGIVKFVVEQRSNVSEYVRIHANLVEETNVIIGNTRGCMINEMNSSSYFGYFPTIYFRSYLPKFEGMKIDVKSCIVNGIYESEESAASTAIICAQRTAANANILADKMVLELDAIQFESDAISKRIEECVSKGFKALADKRSAFERSFSDCINRMIAST